MVDSVMLNSARSFAVTIVDICRMMRGRKKEGVLANQLIRSGTSIGANIY